MRNPILDELKDQFDTAKTYYAPEQKKLRLLDATDRGELWKALGAKFPPYQILPDTNYVSYIKVNLLASLYTVMKSAEIQPTSEEDKQICTELNIAMDKIWSGSNVGYYQFLAGERAALGNLGITQVGWSEKLTGGSGSSFYKGSVTLKNVDPMKYMRDPFAPDLDNAGWCCTFESFHKKVLLRNPLYRDKMKEYIALQKEGVAESLPEYSNTVPKQNAKDNCQLIIHWIRTDDGKINEYHTIDNEFLLYSKEDIKPSVFPFAELYCNVPNTGLIGVSEPSKIFANNVAMNLMDSIALTSEYKNQRPPKFISSQSGLNVNAFTRHGDEADRTFVVNGDATRAVHYHEFPTTSPVVQGLRTTLQYGMEQVTGVDGRYTGRDTGSIITTGGTEEMLNRVTLIDTPKILMYERYAKQLTHLVLANMLEFAPKRTYLYKKPGSLNWESQTVDFPKIPADTLFTYDINISSELPKNKQRFAAMANMLMEKQMQYRQEGSSVQLITEEEWLMFQDLPNKEYMLERMGMQRQTDALQEASQVLFDYAALVEQGMEPNQALMLTADALQKARMGQPPDPNMQAMTMPQPQMGPAPMGGPEEIAVPQI